MVVFALTPPRGGCRSRASFCLTSSLCIACVRSVDMCTAFPLVAISPQACEIGADATGSVELAKTGRAIHHLLARAVLFCIRPCYTTPPGAKAPNSSLDGQYRQVPRNRVGGSPRTAFETKDAWAPSPSRGVKRDHVEGQPSSWAIGGTIHSAWA